MASSLTKRGAAGRVGKTPRKESFMKRVSQLLLLGALILLALFSCLSAPMTLVAASPEEKYFEARDNFIREFEKASDPIDVLDEKDRHALAELEKQLKSIVGPVNVEGFPKEGKINLETLQKGDLGFGQVDGLRFSAEQEYLFVTTDKILKKYLAEQPELPKDLAELSRTAEFYSCAFTSGAAVTYFAEIPVKSPNGKSDVRAFLGLTSQDIGPLIPKDVFVFVTKGNRILAVQSPAAAEITEIPQCRNEWEKFAKKKADAHQVYESSGLKNEKALDEEVQQCEQQGFEAYQRCYEREAKNQKFFAPLEKQAQSIVDRLLRN
jgi:hypothetical protein